MKYENYVNKLVKKLFKENEKDENNNIIINSNSKSEKVSYEKLIESDEYIEK